MLDHIGLAVTDYAKAKAFYEKALAPLGYAVMMEFGDACGLGMGGKPDFWVSAGKPAESLHVAFVAPDRAAVDGFYQAAMAAGGRDNGPPGLRPQYHPNYYGAFVLDPDGANIEAVCHNPA
jgi:catechol 2,3-dioxygenase-like lactoylglutathione lyase family enzyme